MTRGGIASEHALASSIGADILKEGGNAVDAAIATTLAVGTLNPYHSCIGGGGFAIVRSEGGVMDTVDFRVTAPVGYFISWCSCSVRGDVTVLRYGPDLAWWLGCWRSGGSTRSESSA